MAEAQYMPANTDFAGTFFNAANGAQSFMQRAQRMKIEQQQATEEAENHSYQQRLRQQLEPVLQAKNQADIITAKATLATAQQVQQLKAQFGSAIPQAQQEFHDAMQLADFAEQARALSELHQKYSWMSLLPEGKDFVNHISTQQVQANQSFLLDQKFDQERQLAESHIEGQKEVAGIYAAQRAYNSENSLEGRRYAADKSNEARKYAADKTADSRQQPKPVSAAQVMQMQLAHDKYRTVLEENDMLTPERKAQMDKEQDFINQQKDALLSGANGPTPSSAPQFPASMEGKQVRGPDGKVYVVRNGSPVAL